MKRNAKVHTTVFLTTCLTLGLMACGGKTSESLAAKDRIFFEAVEQPGTIGNDVVVNLPEWSFNTDKDLLIHGQDFQLVDGFLPDGLLLTAEVLSPNSVKLSLKGVAKIHHAGVSVDGLKIEFLSSAFFAEKRPEGPASVLDRVAVKFNSELYRVEGQASGVDGLVKLQLGDEVIDITADGAFGFQTDVEETQSFEVAILQAPNHQTCALTNALGNANSAKDVELSCRPKLGADDYQVSGIASGISGTVILQLGSETINVAGNGPFDFSTIIPKTAGFLVTIVSTPSSLNCSLTNASGTSTTAMDVELTCSAALGEPGDDVIF